MTTQPFNKTRLQYYRECVRYYKWLAKRVYHKLGKALYDKFPTEQAREQNKYAQYRTWILQEQSLLKAAINKVSKPNYKDLLTMRYVYMYKWSKIQDIFFFDKADYYDNPEKYREKIQYWHKAALLQLLKTNPEEKTATAKLKKIKKLCRSIADIKKSDFVSQVLSVIG